MSERNFIGKQLINIKDRMPGKASSNIFPKNKTTDAEAVVLRGREKQSEMKQKALLEPEMIKEEINEIPLSSHKVDKKYIKAINAKKEDYLKTKYVVVKMLGDTLSGLEKEIGVIEQKRKVYSDSVGSVRKLLEDISRIEEAKWNSDDFSIELSEAGRIVEIARLENIILKEKLNLKKIEESKNEVKGGISVLDIVSLSFSQVFRLGFGFFLSLIIGVVAAALIVAITILFSMGTL